jgi:transcriptional regulator with XRE-family HTH domain
MANTRTRREHKRPYLGRKTFGSFLKRERARCGLSRHSLAVMTDMQERRLAEIELNQSVPSYQDIKTFAAVLEIPEPDLLEAAGCVKRAQNGVKRNPV